ncbi:MAG: hypothetical protein ABIQ64_01855 [Candidatus Saccharimonadales bacterium]
MPEHQPLDYYHAFRQTRFGKRANEMARWWIYLPEGVSLDQWQDVLGADVNNLEHGRLVYGMTKWYIAQSTDISPDEQRQLLIAAIIHDHAEALDGGEDLPSGTKTPQQRLDEMCALAEAASDATDSGLYPSMSDEARAEAVESVIDVVAGNNKKLSDIFQAIEQLTHIRTVFIALDRLDAGIPDPEVRNGLETLVASGVTITGKKLLEMADDPIVKESLLASRERINQSLEQPLQSTDWQKHFGDRALALQIGYRVRKVQWNEWLESVDQTQSA